DRLVNVALPRVRDFKGVPPKGFDGRGNYALGLREQLIFPEIVYDKVDKVRGMDINIVTTAQTDEEAKALLTHLGMRFREQTDRQGQDVAHHEVAADPEVFDARLSPVQAVRPAPRLPAQVRDVPPVLPRARAQG